LQITCNSYTGGLAAALSKSDTVYHGPLTKAQLARTTVCLPWFSQAEIDAFLAKPMDLVQDGQFWGKRLLATTRSNFVGKFVGPGAPWDKSQSDFADRMTLCAQMMREAPADTLMAMMLPRSQASAFLQAGQNCAHFAVAPDLRFSNMEVGPQWLIPMDLVAEAAGGKILQTMNAVTKFLSATVEYQILEQRYLGKDASCADSSGDSAQLTLAQQAGAARLGPTVPSGVARPKRPGPESGLTHPARRLLPPWRWRAVAGGRVRRQWRLCSCSQAYSSSAQVSWHLPWWCTWRRNSGRRGRR
jgi:hypothetical protein